MRRLVVFVLSIVLTLLIAGAIGQMMVTDLGVLLITWNGWVLETTFWAGLGLILGIIVVVLALVWLFRRLAFFRLVRSFKQRRQHKIAKKETQAAIEHWLAGHEDDAIKSLQRVAQAGGSERLPQAVSLALGLTHSDWPERFSTFTASDPELKNFALMLQAERYWQTNQHEAFLVLLADHPEITQVPWLRERYWQALLLGGQGRQLITRVNEAINIQPDERQRWLVQAVEGAFKAVWGKAEEGANVLRLLSRAQKNLPEVIAAEVRYLISVNANEAAFKRLKQLLQMPAQVEHCDLLLNVAIDNKQKLEFMQKIQPQKPGLVYCRTMGLLNIQLQIWGNARSWLEQGWQLGDRESGLRLAELLQQRNMHAESAELYKSIAQGQNQMSLG
jgi:uncharacterized protein HemY